MDYWRKCPNTNISNGEILQGIYNDLESQGYEVQTFNI